MEVLRWFTSMCWVASSSYIFSSLSLATSRLLIHVLFSIKFLKMGWRDWNFLFKKLTLSVCSWSLTKVFMKLLVISEFMLLAAVVCCTSRGLIGREELTRPWLLRFLPLLLSLVVTITSFLWGWSLAQLLYLFTSFFSNCICSEPRVSIWVFSLRVLLNNGRSRISVSVKIALSQSAIRADSFGLFKISNFLAL